MTFIPVANGVELVVDFAGPGSDAKIILGFRFALPAVVATLQTLIDDFVGAIGTTGGMPWSNQWAITGMTANGLDTATGPTVTDTSGTIAYPFPLVGAIASPAEAANVSDVVTLQTGLRGRSYRGRNYWPGVPESRMADDSHTTIAHANEWNAFLASIIPIMSVAATPLVVISRYHAGAPRIAGIMTDVTNPRAETKIGTQRRRVAP